MASRLSREICINSVHYFHSRVKLIVRLATSLSGFICLDRGLDLVQESYY